MTLSYKFPPEVQEWIDIVEANDDNFKVCKDQILLVKHVKRCFEQQDIYIDEEQLSKYMHLCDSYVPFNLFPWQKFVIALHDCTYWKSSGQPRWTDLFCMLGRGAGKDGTIAVEGFCLSSPYNGIKNYDVDICANNEEQAVRPVEDLVSFFEVPEIEPKIKRFYHWTKQRVLSKKTGAKIKGRTNSPKGKDGLRSGIVIFNEIHQYENYDNINVFTTGLGKKEHPRRSYYTTNGDIRDGPLDDIIADCEDILNSDSVDDNGLIPFICRLDCEEDIDDPTNWVKANPSLPFLPSLRLEIEKEYKEWKKNPDRLPAFKTKRMNLTPDKKETAVTKWEYIKATNKSIPNLKGWSCTVGIDYSKINDWVSVNFHFKDGDKRYDINFAFMCKKSEDAHRIKAPWKEWGNQGKLTIVDDVEIHPSIIANCIYENGKKYNITMVAIDSYRYALLADALSKIGISKEKGNLMLVKQTDIIKIVPVIDSCFNNGYFHWGDNPVLRWATNNTKVIRYGKDVGADKGSFVYAKIEAKSRKTDPFMALVASMIPESQIKNRPGQINTNIKTIVI